MLLTQLVMAGLSHKALQVNFGELNFSLVSLPVAPIISNLKFTGCIIVCKDLKISSESSKA